MKTHFVDIKSQSALSNEWLEKRDIYIRNWLSL